ncbi:bifunctional RecB family nuclease/DEAD/DEAH box helicase [Naasia sp. SYSU D00057]|uniref:TM0106 family RecB-like putative nuclease n=1 Tax=Naasia sp. SYSU D00057 TaxID=2817380 RepID=UPI001B31791E|nr:bifunctional RecB family nuclease/DEAD/DEAH box helicase [Naasia sp. SYSU D00057]
MFVRNDVVHYSASDLTAAVTCEWALMRLLDAKLGRIPAVQEPEDLMQARAAVLGGTHEERTLAAYREQFGKHTPGVPGGVAEIPRPEPSTDADALRAAMALTVQAMRDGAQVVFQGTFFDGRFVGFADFLVRTETPDGSVYEVYDTKLARRAKISALLQLAAYALQLKALGIPVGDEVHLLLGDGSTSTHRLADILPVYRDRIARLLHMIDERVAAGEPLPWGAPGYTACGRCAACSEQVEATRDVLLVARLTSGQRRHLADAGITTIDQLAASEGAVDGIGPATLEKLRDQARMQLSAPPVEPGARPAVRYRVHDTAGLAALPAPDDGDIFFDFEGDPLWTDGDPRFWGLEYLFGIIDHDGEREHFRPFWAHDRAQEKQALLDFLGFVTERRRRHPGMHIYHYADYERSHLQQLCARHGVGEAMLDELLREHVFVDLYPVVMHSIRISERSYSLKKLEPLYMGDELRESDVTNAADSIVAYVDYTLLRDAGREHEAAEQLAEIEEYNRYDCVSTLRLRDWLLARADEAGIGRRRDVLLDEPRESRIAGDEDRVRDRLLAAIEGIASIDRTADQQAIALAAAAIEYHRREDKTYWWEHFNREITPLEEWADQREVLVVESAEVVSDWELRGRKKSESRILRLRGRLAPASRLDVGAQPHAMYDGPVPPGCAAVPEGQRGEHDATDVMAVTETADGTEVLLEETAGEGVDLWTALPIALTPARPINTSAQRRAILEWGEEVVGGLPALGPGAALDLLRRRPPQLHDGGLDPIVGGDTVSAITGSLRRLDRSYLAVQGPPGSGKTFVGASVIARLVEEGWKIGVVAQSHEVVENVLRRVVGFGVDPSRVGKRSPKRGYETPPEWTVLTDNKQVIPFILANKQAGFVLGGTAWDFANASKVPRNVLDLLVIDEAGQFSLANTIAVGTSARRLLLLGDPQQLPQVSQGLHPEPVDESALGWLSDGHDVLPAGLGYFLSETWRMHPALCAAVSDLSYENRLTSRLPETTDRVLEGVHSGLHPAPVIASGNATESPEEVARVLELVRSHVGLPWTDPSVGRVRDPLRPDDIIVVAPYNAQVALIRRALDDAGFRETPVGTVDKFQGQEAPVAIVSLTASSADDVPRGIAFLLLRNRLNVAVSRAKWAAYLVHSPALADYLPHTPDALAELAGFLRLTGGKPEPEPQSVR